MLWDKGVGEYVEAAKILNQEFGDKVKFIVLKEPNSLREKVISFPTHLPQEFDLHKYMYLVLKYKMSQCQVCTPILLFIFFYYYYIFFFISN